MPEASRSLSRSSSSSPVADEYEESSYSSYSVLESSSVSPRKPPIPRVVGDRYRVGKKVGSGSYSDVHIAVDKISGDEVAVKIEWTKAEKTNKLLAEAELYQQFKHALGIPRVRWWGSQGEYNIMVLDLLGPSLDDHFKKLKRFSIKTVVMLGKQMIDRLEEVHERGILYRDMKPHNFLMGLGEKGSGRVHLVDFGLAKRWNDEVTGVHAKLNIKKGRGITGTVRYSSPNVHEGYDASRRDDLLALGYTLLHFLRGGLPWLRITAKDKKHRNELIRRKKTQTSDEDLCQGFPRELVEYFTYCRALEFYDRPDYMRLQRLFDDLMDRKGYVNDLSFDWTPKEAEKVEEVDRDSSRAKRRRLADPVDTEVGRRR